MKTSGILLPIFSLPSDYGIGCFSKEAYKFVDFLEEAGRRIRKQIHNTVRITADAGTTAGLLL